jgi:hypothetical protein
VKWEATDVNHVQNGVLSAGVKTTGAWGLSLIPKLRTCEAFTHMLFLQAFMLQCSGKHANCLQISSYLRNSCTWTIHTGTSQNRDNHQCCTAKFLCSDLQSTECLSHLTRNPPWQHAAAEVVGIELAAMRDSYRVPVGGSKLRGTCFMCT